MFFWANDDKKTRVDITTLGAALEKYDEPPYLIQLITTHGRQTLNYSYNKDLRDSDTLELRRLRDEYHKK